MSWERVILLEKRNCIIGVQDTGSHRKIHVWVI